MLMKRTELLLAHRMQASGRQYFFTMWKVSTRNAKAEHRMEEATRDAQRTTQQGRLSSIARFERMCRGRSDGRRITLAFSLWARNTARISSGHLTTVVQQRLEEMRAQCVALRCQRRERRVAATVLRAWWREAQAERRSGASRSMKERHTMQLDRLCASRVQHRLLSTYFSVWAYYVLTQDVQDKELRMQDEIADSKARELKARTAFSEQQEALGEDLAEALEQADSHSQLRLAAEARAQKVEQLASDLAGRLRVALMLREAWSAWQQLMRRASEENMGVVMQARPEQNPRPALCDAHS